MDPLVGFTFHDWLQLLRENRYSISSKYFYRAYAITIMAIRNSIVCKKEEQAFGAAIDQAQVQPPIFVLGHWRSGTTLLHSLLVLDDQFAYPNLFEVTHPHTFILQNKRVQKALSNYSAEKRAMDNVRVTYEDPGEDEPALAVLSLRSPVLAWMFPQNERSYDRYLTFRQASPSDLDCWKRALLWFMKKLSFRYNKPLILKSPPHTARIRNILRVFPEARFIHIQRDPYSVFKSTQRMYRQAMSGAYLQTPNGLDIETGILERYRDMYDAYFDDLALIPVGNFCEVSYEQLEQDIVGTLACIYDQLSIDGFMRVKPRLEERARSNDGYQKNVYQALDEQMRERVFKAWERNFTVWGYQENSPG